LALERRLVLAAQQGDRRAREELPTVLSDRTLRQLAQLKRAHGGFVQRHGREPTGAELAAEIGLTREQVSDLLAVERLPQSLDEPVSGPEGELGAFGELLVDPLAGDAYEQLLDHSEIEQVRALLGSMNERERVVLRSRYGLDGPEQSLRDVGDRLGLSGERVRQIERRALGKLRAAHGPGQRCYLTETDLDFIMVYAYHLFCSPEGGA
jgi:RNA polymerase primary sigma factor